MHIHTNSLRIPKNPLISTHQIAIWNRCQRKVISAGGVTCNNPVGKRTIARAYSVQLQDVLVQMWTLLEVDWFSLRGAKGHHLNFRLYKNNYKYIDLLVVFNYYRECTLDNNCYNCLNPKINAKHWKIIIV